MTRRSLGLLLLIFGLVVGSIGLIGMFSSADGSSNQALSTTTTAIQDNETTTTSSTSTTTTSTTQVADSTTTSVLATTTTTLDDAAAIEAFVEEFSEAIRRQDVEYLMAALHPAVLEVFDEELCRAFIEDEILLLGDSRLTGPIQGPTPQTIGSFTVDMYTAPVAFTFQGEDFESDASYVIEENGVTWFTDCR